MIIKTSFPAVDTLETEDYKLTPIDDNSIYKQRKYCYIMMLLLYYTLCFGLGLTIQYYHSLFVEACFWFLGYFLISIIIILPAHLILRSLLLGVNIFGKECYGVFNTEYLMPYFVVDRVCGKRRLIVSYLIPLILLSIAPFIFFMYLEVNLFIYALFCTNTLISVFDIYDSYILIKKAPVACGVVKNNNIFHVYRKNYNVKDEDIVSRDKMDDNSSLYGPIS